MTWSFGIAPCQILSLLIRGRSPCFLSDLCHAPDQECGATPRQTYPKCNVTLIALWGRANRSHLLRLIGGSFCNAAPAHDLAAFEEAIRSNRSGPIVWTMRPKIPFSCIAYNHFGTNLRPRDRFVFCCAVSTCRSAALRSGAAERRNADLTGPQKKKHG
jgi:hypothetical protein